MKCDVSSLHLMRSSYKRHPLVQAWKTIKTLREAKEQQSFASAAGGSWKAARAGSSSSSKTNSSSTGCLSFLFGSRGKEDGLNRRRSMGSDIWRDELGKFRAELVLRRARVESMLSKDQMLRRQCEDRVAAENQMLCCPISGFLMTDPVTAADGYTYERDNIMEWLKRTRAHGQARSPMTGTKLTSETFLATLVVRTSILQAMKASMSDALLYSSASAGMSRKISKSNMSRYLSRHTLSIPS